VDRHIRFSALANFRDLGGWTAADGRRVRPGRLYRADSLGGLGEGFELVEGVGVVAGEVGLDGVGGLDFLLGRRAAGCEQAVGGRQ
jgi:hypothetical protein